jgi:RNA polymerase sigma-70 factor (ECF subfamily)
MRFTQQKHTAEDLVQDTLLRAYTFWDQFTQKTEDAYRDAHNWLKRILNNLYYNQYVRDRRYVEVLEEYSSECTPENKPPDLTEVVSLLEKITPGYRKAIELRYVHHKEFSEIAESLGVTEVTVRTRICRGLNQLKAVVQPDS